MSKDMTGGIKGAAGTHIQTMKNMIEYVNESPYQFGYKAEGDSGYDIRAAEEKVIKPGEIVLIPTGIYMAIPKGLEGQVRSRSGLAAKHGVHVLNQPGTIDASYRGEVKVLLHHEMLLHYTEEDAYTVADGERIAQIVFQKVPQTFLSQVGDLDATDRGADGFGSTGRM